MGKASGPAPVDGEHVSTDRVMELLHERIRQRISGSVDPFESEAIERLYARAARRRVLAGDHLRGDSRHNLRTFIRFASHRRFGGWITLVKRRVLFPLTYWLFEFARDNFELQQEINEELSASLEELAIENATLRREIATLRASSSREPEQPASTQRQ